jgi:hypothetical protein
VSRRSTRSEDNATLPLTSREHTTTRLAPGKLVARARSSFHRDLLDSIPHQGRSSPDG